MTSLLQTLERDQLAAKAAQEVVDLHTIFVEWFRGTRPLSELKTDLRLRLASQFSHVAPNGQFLAGRQVLLSHLQDKYGCYADRVFEIDIYNVQVIWTDANHHTCLVTYEEWQSWQQDDDDEDQKTQQFGRLSTCLLSAKNNAKVPFQWIHVHETWLEEEVPAPTAVPATLLIQQQERPTMPMEDDTIMTGPMLPPAGGMRSARATPTKQPKKTAVATPPKRRQEPSKQLLVLISRQSLANDQQTALDMLDQHNIQYLLVDGADPAQRERRNQLFGISKLPGKYPQFFFVLDDQKTVEFWGPFARLSQVHDKGTLVQELTGMEPEPEQDDDDDDESSSSDGSSDRAASAMAAMTGLAAGLHKHNKKAAAVHDESPTASVLSQMSSSKIAMNSAPSWTLASSDHSTKLSSDELSKPHPEGSSSSGDETDEFSATEGQVLVFENDGQSAGSAKEQEETGKNVKKDQKTAETVESVEDLEPEERAFLEASKGILVFEDDAQSEKENEEQTRATPAPKGPEQEPEGELPLAVTQTATSIPNDVSKKRHISPKLDKYAKPLMWEGALVGISIAGFDIGTSQGPIADEAWYKENGARMEEMAQSFSIPKPRRRIGLPEMVYPVAHVALEGNGVWLSWDAKDALESWAKCHHMIAVLSRIGWHGVNVIKSNDAKNWADKRKHISDQEAAASVFHYDWTFGTPYCGTVEGGEWTELDESGMRMDLLTDQSVPILFFDEIMLFEDDLHDNGQTQYAVKLRVMPTCAYILARLWVRVDNIMIRVRETRILVDFFGIKPQIFRDVTWKECLWEHLADHGLPTDVRAWRFDGRETPAWNQQLNKLPEVNPPKETIMKHAVLDYTSKSGGGGENTSNGGSEDFLAL